MDASSSFGQRVRRERHRHDYTLKQLASLTGLSVSYLSDLENDRSRPSLDTLRNLAGALQTTADVLMGPGSARDHGSDRNISHSSSASANNDGAANPAIGSPVDFASDAAQNERPLGAARERQPRWGMHQAPAAHDSILRSQRSATEARMPLHSLAGDEIWRDLAHPGWETLLDALDAACLELVGRPLDPDSRLELALHLRRVFESLRPR